MSNEERGRRLSPPRIAFICLAVVAAVYSAYSMAAKFLAGGGDAADTARYRLLGESEKPQEAELVGMWIPDEKTAAGLKSVVASSATAPPPRLIVEKNSFRIADVPYFAKESLPRVSYASAGGTWNLYRQQGTWALYSFGLPFDARALLYGDGRRYRMRLVIGDPSLNEPLWFVKRSPQETPPRE